MGGGGGGMLFLFPMKPFMWIIEGFVERIVHICIIVCFWFALCHRLGIIQRIVHRLVEIELSKLLNGCRITMSRIEFDIITGSVVVYDGIIHSPSREIWKWDSPLVARFGRVTAKVNLFSIIDPISYICGYTFRDIHYVICDDIQVFVEKRRNIFNFHLLDESLDIPLPPESLINNNHDIGTSTLASTLTTTTTTTTESSLLPSSSDHVVRSSSLEEGVVAGHGGDDADQKANEIVSSVFKTVSQLGKAAGNSSGGGKEELTNVFKSHRDGLVTKLKEFQETSQQQQQQQLVQTDGGGGRGGIEYTSSYGNNSMVNSPPGIRGGIGSNTSTSTSTTAIGLGMAQGKVNTGTGAVNHPPPQRSSIELFAKESLKVVKSMSKAVERNVTEIQQSLKPPEKKKNYVKAKDDLLRIGYLVFRDIRVFTKDVILSSGGSGTGAGGIIGNTSVGQTSPSAMLMSNASMDSTSQQHGSTTTTNKSIAKWSKPILLKEVIFDTKDLCNPIGLVKDENGLPQIGMEPERLVDILVRRALAEMAKTNTGRVFNNAVSEVFAWMDSVGSSSGTNINASESPI